MKKHFLPPVEVPGHFLTGGIMVTVKDVVREKIDKAAKWRKENPWHSPEYFKDESKIYITKDMLESDAYRSLSKIAMLIYQDFLAKREMISTKRNRKTVWQINNNGEIVYPYAEAEENGFSRKQFRDAIDELQKKGFIDITHIGKGGRKPAKGTGDVTKYWIDNRWIHYETDDFKPARNPRPKDNRTDRGWALYNRKKKIISVEKDTRKRLTGVKKGTR